MNKLTDEQKVKLIYSGELVVFAVVFIVLGILELVRVITISDKYLAIFNWITIFGGVWLIADLIWALVNPRRRKKVSLLDKFLNLPLGIVLIVFDMLSFFGGEHPYEFRMYFMASAFIYLGVNYLFQGIYHWWHPIPGLFDDLEKEKEKAIEGETKAEEEKPAEQESEEKD